MKHQCICSSEEIKHAAAGVGMSCASSKLISLVSFHLSSHHLHHCLLYHSHYVSMIPSQANSPSSSLTRSAKVSLSATVILINYHCKHVLVPERHRWHSWTSCCCFRGKLRWNRREVRRLNHI